MNPLSWLFKPRALAYLFVAAITLGALGVLITFLISDGQKVAAKTVLGSANVERSIGRVSSALLIGSSSKYAGALGCEEFRYLVFGEDGTEVVAVRIEARSGKNDVRKVLELIEGAKADFNIACWQKPDRQAFSGAGEIATGGVSP